MRRRRPGHGERRKRKAYEANDLYFIGPIQHDLDIIHSKVPIRSFEDFKKKKTRMPGDLIGEVFKAAGADVATFPGGKVYGALKDGQIEAADFVGPAVNLSLGFAEICKYDNVGYVTDAMLVDEKGQKLSI